MRETISRTVYATSRGMAWAGGLVLVLITAVSVLSIAGRALSGLGLGPVPGDFELVEAGTALAVFAFLPWCHLRGGHAMVDMFWQGYPAPMRRAIELLTELLTLGVWTLLVWRMGAAMLEYRENAETTFILHMPVWWGYAAAMVPAVFGCVVYTWRLAETLGLAQRPAGFALDAGGH
jgi:TRAP-type C4-dicarboxylate transport system permease small subunit